MKRFIININSALFGNTEMIPSRKYCVKTPKSCVVVVAATVVGIAVDLRDIVPSDYYCVIP